MATLDLAAPKLGSGARFHKLEGTLAARGAHNPAALAAWIGRKKYGRKGFSKLSHHKHANDADLGIYLAETAKDAQGLTLTCPECNYSGPAGRFGASGAPLDAQPEVLRTPAAGNTASAGFKPASAGIQPRSNSAPHALSSTRAAVELAAGVIRRPVQGPVDVIVARRNDGTAVLRHRNGGAEIAALRKDGGKWVATVNGKDLPARDHQRTALMEAVGTWNGAIRDAVRPQGAPLQPPPQQTELMAEYGIPAMRSAAFATPATGAGAGPRVTLAATDGDGDDDTAGLSPKGKAIYHKLRGRGFPAKRALAFARNSEKAKSGQFAKA